MKTNLAAWLKENGVVGGYMASQIGLTPDRFSTLRRGVAKPTLAEALAIERYTKGEVPCEAWELE